MTIEVSLSPCGRYVLVRQEGLVLTPAVKASRASARPLFEGGCDRALVDFRLADLSHLRLIDLDDLGISLIGDVPKCVRMAIVRTPGIDDKRYAHAANVQRIRGVETELFSGMEGARAWLLKED